MRPFVIFQTPSSSVVTFFLFSLVDSVSKRRGGTHSHADTAVALNDTKLSVGQCVPRFQRLHFDGESHGPAVAVSVILRRIS